ncbi:MAG: DUF4337 domain-containing protein [Armatimonadetes bacterium]|nr:DUF4337 domain-containing protein [Armatimonadota bacterium]
MPDEIEVPIDEVREKVDEAHHERFHKRHHPEKEKEEEQGGWMRYVAVATALLAVIAAIGALRSGLLVNESLLEKNEQISRLTQASDTWNYYQAEGLKSLIYQTTAQGLPAGSAAQQQDLAQSDHYKKKQDDLRREAERLNAEADEARLRSKRFLDAHHTFAYSVSLCQIAIALSAVAALTRRASIWYLGLAAGGVGLAFLLFGFLHG